MPASVLSLVDGLIQQTAGIATESDLASALAELTPGITAPLCVLSDCDYAPNGYSWVNGTNVPYTQNTPSIMDGILYQVTSDGLGTNNGPQFAFQILYAKYNNGEIIASLPYYRQATWQTTGMVWTEWDHAIDWAVAATAFAPIAGDTQNTFEVAPATAGNQAPQWQQVQAAITALSNNFAGIFAPIAGDVTQTFSVAQATSVAQAPSWGQVQAAIAAAIGAGGVTEAWAKAMFAPLAGNAEQAFAVAPGAGAQAAQMQQVENVVANYLPLAGGTLTGALTVNSVGDGGAALSIYGANNSNGAGIELLGSGTTTPNKYMRAYNGLFQLLNSAYTAPIFQIDDLGNVNYVNSIAVTSTIYLLDENGGNVAFYVNPGTYDFVIGSGNPSNRFFLVFSGETGVFTLPSNAEGSMDALPLGQAQSLFQPIKTQYKVANLPTGVAAGTEAQVTDASNPVWHQTLAGGGATLCNALYNGTAWVAT